MKEKILKSLFLCGFEIILFIIINILISSISFILNISISKYHAIISLMISLLIILFIAKKKKLLSKNNIIYILMYTLLPIIIIGGTLFLNGKVIDTSYDGNAYQKATIGLLKNGWNPVYESSEEFDENNNSVFLEESGHSIWIDHYARASHIYQANIYALTGNIECGKSINTLSIISLFLIIFSLLANHFKKIVFPLIFSICAITPSVISSQFLTSYVDLLTYIYLLLLVVSFFYLDYKENKVIGLILYFICLLMLINIKFNAFAYAGIYCLAFYIYYIIQLKRGKIDKKYFRNFTIISALAVLIGVFVIGLSVYPKNFLENGNPFYPLYGEGKVDIITANQPESFKSMNTPKKYFISMFSKVDNIGWWSNYEPSLKIPFTFDDYEVDNMKYSDTRISGNGVMFGGIFIISILCLAITSIKIFKNNKKLFVLCTIPIIVTIILALFLSESWWARYFPQTYFLVLIALLYLYIQKSNTSLVFVTLISTLLLYNNLITFNQSVNYAYEFKKDISTQFSQIEETLNENDALLISTSTYTGALYNTMDYFKNYNIEIVNPRDDLDDYKLFFSSQIYWKVKENKSD